MQMMQLELELELELELKVKLAFFILFFLKNVHYSSRRQMGMRPL
jgi:hypothetical protein